MSPTLSRTRTWGSRFDALVSSPPLSPSTHQVSHTSDPAVVSAPTVSPNASINSKDERMSHHSSIFVGSLPTNVNQPDLIRLLSEYLSEYAEIKNVKVIRDAKGGVCAFVQCEDPSAAANLIHVLQHAPQKPFLGRYLRYEFARALRTLLISYRSPAILPPVEVVGRSFSGSPGKHTPFLPYAMKMWRSRSSKYWTILYNVEAQAARGEEAIDSKSLYLEPILYNAENIRKLASLFGPLDIFKLYEGPVQGQTSCAQLDSYPAPHDASRTPDMDPRCWEVKWEHRDDCVNALSTLRRVPHLTVTWAHHHAPQGAEQHSPHQGQFPASRFACYTMNRRVAPDGAPRTPGDTPATSFPSVQHNAVSMSVGSPHEPYSSSELNGVVCDNPSSVAPVTSTTQSDTHHPSLTESEVDSSLPSLFDDNDGTKHKISWSDMDSPLSDAQESVTAECIQRERVAVVDIDNTEWTPRMQLKITPTQRPLLLPGPSDGSGIRLEVDSSLDCTLQTSSDMTTDLDGHAQQGSGGHLASARRFAYIEPHDRDTRVIEGRERGVDPTTLFVGGLDMFGPHTWDETKVTNFFARYEGLESVKVVRPVNSRAAFAFVKFTNTESPALAVAENHNHVYEGKQMRVQLREYNPIRGLWKFGRGRGRYSVNTLHRVAPVCKFTGINEALDGSIRGCAGHPGNTLQVEAKPLHPSSSTSMNTIKTEELVDPKESEGREYNTTNTSTSPEEPASCLSNRSIENSGVTPESAKDPNNISLSPSPPNLDSSTSVSSVPTMPSISGAPSTPGMPLYPLMGPGYYPPPWAPFPHQLAYPPFCYNGYPGAMLHPTPIHHTPLNTDVNAAATGLPTVYGPYAPHPCYLPRTTDLSQQSSSHAPLQPCGFVQNDGALVPCYNQEALTQYMTTTGQPLEVPQSQSKGQSLNVPGFVPSQSDTNVPSNPPMWPYYPQPYPYHPPLVPSLPSRQFHHPIQWNASVGWVSGQAPSDSSLYARSKDANPPNTAPVSHGPTVEMGYGQHLACQQYGRRDQNFYSNSSRNHGRPFTYRHHRGGRSHPGYHFLDGDPAQQQSHQPQSNGALTDWNQWNTGR